LTRYARSQDEYHGLFGFVECVESREEPSKDERKRKRQREKGAPKEQHPYSRG